MQLLGHRLLVAAGHPLNTADFITGEPAKAYRQCRRWKTSLAKNSALPIHSQAVQATALTDTHVPLRSSLHILAPQARFKILTATGTNMAALWILHPVVW